MGTTTSTSKKKDAAAFKTQHFWAWDVFGWVIQITLSRPIPKRKRKYTPTGNPPGRPKKKAEEKVLPPPGAPLPME